MEANKTAHQHKQRPSPFQLISFSDTDSNDNALVITDIQRPAPVAPRSVYSDVAALEERSALVTHSAAARWCRALSGQNMANVLYAIEMAKNVGLSVISVMQGSTWCRGSPAGRARP